MIYLIGGAPRCGKTTLAQKLSKDLKISWLAADSLEGVVAAYLSKSDLTKLFPKSVMRKKTKRSNDLMYDTYSTKEITDVYIKQAQAIWKATRALIQASIYEGHDLIIEGYQLQPKLVAQLQKDFKEVKAVMLVKTDLESIIAGALNSTNKNDWFISNTEKPETYRKMGLMIEKYSAYIIKEGRNYHLRVIDSSSNFKKSVNLAAKHLKSK